MTQAALDIHVFRCQGCGALHERRPVICPSCLGEAFDDHSVPGVGTLASWTTIRKPPLAHRGHGPYDVAVIDLSVGLRITGRIVSKTHETGSQAELQAGLQARRQAELRVGAPVGLTHRIDSGGETINVFEVMETIAK
ncbi:MAG TPA: OB-fold domain-containing protein [Orrella sp.]